jgi:DNA-binding NtrC family response regulator
MSSFSVNSAVSSAVVASSNNELRRQVLESLRASDCAVQEARGGAEALAKLAAGGYQVLLLDKWLPDLDVSELLDIVKARHPLVEIVVIEHPGAKADGWKSSAWDHREARTTETSPSYGTPETVASAELSKHPEAEPPVEPLPGMIGASQTMRNVYRLSRLVALRSTTVLLTGETGTGKELVAKAIHLLSPRRKQPFITVNCAAIPESLLESELFGYARGAFTGAFQSRIGRIHAAHGGTLFLDEVGDLPLSMQAKLLRFLQEGEVQRLGGQDIVRVDVRVIAATNAHLAKRVAEKAFREDLYYRVAAFPIDLVPLRLRPEDILPLGSHFLKEFCQESGFAQKRLSDSACKALQDHSWPGNVRELRHVMDRAFILSEDGLEVRPSHISVQTPWR